MEEADFDPDDDKPLDEFGYEKFMRESDARTDKYMKLLEKYEGHPEQEKIVAREMGWECLEEALEADERGALPPREEMKFHRSFRIRSPKALTGFATSTGIFIIR